MRIALLALLVLALAACRPTAQEVNADTLQTLVTRYTEAQDARVREAQAAAATVTAVAVLALVAVIVIAGASAVVVVRRPRVIERPQRLLAPPGEVRVPIPRRIGQEVER